MVNKKYRQSFGCCSGLSESLLQTGGAGYPKWYMNYILGRGDKKLVERAKKVLVCLSDGLWKMKVGVDKVGVGTIEALVELEMIEMKPIKKKGNQFVAGKTESPISDLVASKSFSVSYEKSAAKGGFFGAYRITKRGVEALDNGFLP